MAYHCIKCGKKYKRPKKGKVIRGLFTGKIMPICCGQALRKIDNKTYKEIDS